jgi:hypothetical protein
MTKRFIASLLKVTGWVTAFVFLSVVAQERAVEGPPAAISVCTKTNLNNSDKSPAIPSKAAEQKQQTKPLPATPIQEILKMLDAGVSKEVIKGYVESAPMNYNASAADIISLKQHGIPDDITLALLKRGTESRLQNSQATEVQPAPVSVVSRDNHFYPDPESYDYFQYYYLYPRTLASANERLGIYPAPYFSGSYGSFGPYSPRGLYFGNRRGVYAP